LLPLLLRSAGQTETVAGSDGNELLARDVAPTSSSYFRLVEGKGSTPTLCLVYADGYLTLAATLENCLEKETNATTDPSVQSALLTRIARRGRVVRAGNVSGLRTLAIDALLTQTALASRSAGTADVVAVDAILTQTAMVSRSAGTADARHAKWLRLCKCWWRWRF